MRWLRAAEDVLRRPWFGHAALLAVCVTILVAAATMSGSTESVSLFGHPIPVMCTWRRLTGWSCPGCGLTRSFVFLAHGQVAQAFAMNPAGPVVFVWVAAQIPWRIWMIHRRLRNVLPS